MRDNDRVILMVKTNGVAHYDPVLGKKVGGETTEKIVSCNISEQGIQLTNALEEKMELDTRIVRLREDVPNVDKVFIKDKPYRVVTRRNKALYVEEIPNT